jgi:excisionase family DNA binding protein
MQDERAYTVNQVAERLQIHPQTVREWLRTGKLKGARLGGTKAGWRIPASEVERILGVEPSVLAGPPRPPVSIHRGETIADLPGPDQRSAIARSADGPRGAAFARQQAEVARLEGNEDEALRWNRIAEAAEQREGER